MEIQRVSKIKKFDIPSKETQILGFECIEILYRNVYNQNIDFRIQMTTIYGYWRCSTDAQDQERQIRSLNEAGCEKVVGDFITGTSNYGDRKELSKGRN